MLSLLNHSSTMAMNMPCCQYAPYCAHNSRQMQSQVLPSLGLGLGGESASWNNRLPTHHDVQFSFNRPQQTSLFPSQTLGFLSEHDKVRPPSTSSYSTSTLSTSWTTPTYPMLSNGFGSTPWLTSRNKDSLHGPGSTTFSHEGNNYISGTKYEPMELREISPSPATDFPNVSTSSQASSTPATTYMSYGSIHSSKGDSPYLSSQPLQPEQLCAVDDTVRRMSVASFDPESPSRSSRGRSRKGSEPIQCHICRKSFDRRSNFKSHWETHDKDRQRTVCKIDGCNKTFGRPAEMTRHVNSAHRQKSFPCVSCGKDFTRHDILLRHCKDACPVLVKGKVNGKRRRSKDL